MQIFLCHMYLIYIQWVQAKIVHDIIYCLLTNNSSIVAISYISKKVNKIEILHENSTDILGVDGLQNFFLGQCSHSAISDFCVGSLQFQHHLSIWEVLLFSFCYQKTLRNEFCWKFCQRQTSVTIRLHSKGKLNDSGKFRK